MRSNLFLEATAAERTDGVTVFANQHARPGPAIARAFRANERGQRESLSRALPEFAQNVVNIFHS